MNDEEISSLKAGLAEDTKRYNKHDKGRADAAEAAMAKALSLLRANVPPTEVVRLSPFSDAYIRKAAREAGIPPARPPRGITAQRPANSGGSES